MGTEIGQPWQAIHRHLIEHHGLDLSRYKESYLKRRLLVRMRALRLPGIEAYARYLRRHPEELGRLQKALSIKVTGLTARSEEHTSELQSRGHLVCRLLLEKKKHIGTPNI